MDRNYTDGFTLIELSIVLVIVGLIAGGVVVGQDLIRSAEIRATISQVEKYKAAVNTFRVKYNGLPGDLMASQAIALGFQPRAGTAGRGDNDGFIEYCTVGPLASSQAGCETLLFWSDLSAALLIDGSFTTATDIGAGNIPSSQIGLYLPSAKFGKGTYIAAIAGNIGGGTTNYNNYFFVGGITSFLTVSAIMATTPTMTPLDARQIDIKTDDGLPLTGQVTSVTEVAVTWIETDTLGASNCNTSTNAYNTSGTFSTKQVCMLDMGF